MIKHIVLIMAMAIVVVQSQRPTYAGSANRIPGVLPQYLPQQQSTPNLDNRIDIDETPAPPSPSQTEQLPLEAGGDINLINRIKTWPRENQPFWYLNWRQLAEHRGKPASISGPVNSRPFFAGSSSRPSVHPRFQES